LETAVRQKEETLRLSATMSQQQQHQQQQLSLIVTLENSDDMHSITVRASDSVADTIAVVATAVRANAGECFFFILIVFQPLLFSS
jgi:hypothetical protein